MTSKYIKISLTSNYDSQCTISWTMLLVINNFRANIELISLIGNGNATSVELETGLPNSMFINGIALNIQVDAVNDLSNCAETILGMMKYLDSEFRTLEQSYRMYQSPFIVQLLIQRT